MFECDICMCCSGKCPRADECKRHRLYGMRHEPGDIFTVSDFRSECNENNNYPMFLED